ncbi:MAG: sensor histidine kinase [Planctomycetaceae bacterium]
MADDSRYDTSVPKRPAADMSYRTFKRLMGETSLERKCRFLFGGGLMLLIAASFYFYGRLNASLVRQQAEQTARKLVGPTLLKAHWEADSVDPKTRRDLLEMFQPGDTSEVPFESGVFRVDNPYDRKKRFLDGADYKALEVIRQTPGRTVAEFRTDAKSGDEHLWFYQGVYATVDSCADCHNKRAAEAGEPNQPELQVGSFMGVVRIGIPMQETNRQLAQNKMVLLALAIVTAFLAMLAAYIIVRYVIVKPVLHLKDVSDGIARGTLDLRADIRTGDEFEELSHAFNRMLRHLVTVQNELLEVNADLDGKVDELAQVNLQLYETNKLKDEFLATMSHELRTPLNSILGFSEILSGADNLKSNQRRYLNNIRISGEDLMGRINDVLDLAKIESGKMHLQAIDFSLSDLIERQVGTLMPLAEKKNIDLTCHVAPDVPPLFQDYGKVQQILTNLLSNSIKYTPEGGRVNVRAEADGDWFRITVEDTGIGIRLEEQETIFEKFRQGKLTPGQEDAMTREYGGTGLGLSIVKELSILLGGEVGLESEFGKGSTFTVRAPVRMPNPPLEAAATAEAAWSDESSMPLRPAPGIDQDGDAVGDDRESNEPAA